MLQNGDFWMGLVIALMAIGAVTTFVAVLFGIYKLWQFSRPVRDWIAASLVVRVLQVVSAQISSLVKSTLDLLIVRPWQFCKEILTALVEIFEQIPWEEVLRKAFAGFLILCVVALFVSLPFDVLVLAGFPAPVITGIATAGALIGLLVGSVLFWLYRNDGLSRAVGKLAVAVPAGAWGSTMLIAFLIAMASD